MLLRLGLFIAGLYLSIAQAAPVLPALERPAQTLREIPSASLQSIASAASRLVAVGERGVIVISDDQAHSWQQVDSPVSVGLTSVRFVDSRHGWATGHGAVVLATTDGGSTWARQLDGNQAAQQLLAAAGSGAGPAVEEAERMVADGADKPLLDLWFFDAQHGIVVGAYGLAFETLDGGQHWQGISSRFPGGSDRHLYAIRARGNEVLVAGESGTLLYSNDRGRTFRRCAVPYEGSFFTAQISASGELLVAGLRGNLWKSSDAGEHWSRVPALGSDSIVASAVDAQGQVLLANQGGSLMRLEHDHLLRLPGQLPPLNGILALDNGESVVASVRGVFLVKRVSLK